MHNQVAEFVVYADVATVSNSIEQFVNYKPVLTFVYIDFELRCETDELWWFHAPRLYEKTACGGIKLVPVPEGTLLRAVDFADSICKIALEQYVRDMQIWFHRFGLLRPKSRTVQPTVNTTEMTAPSTNDIMHRLDEMQLELGGKLEDLKRGQAIIYQRINVQSQVVLEMILNEVRQQRIEQSEMHTVLDAIRRVLKHIQNTGLPVADDKVKQSLADIYQAVNSNMTLHQQLELSLPIIPFLLEYKIGLDAGVDLGAVWRELVERVQKAKNRQLDDGNSRQSMAGY